MQNKKTIHVAVVDSCEFTMIGLQSLGKREPDEKHDVIFHGFTHIEELAMSEQLFDIIIYDPLNTRHFRVTTNDDILCIKQKQVTAKIYIYSLSAGYLKFKHVDGVISKRVSWGYQSAVANTDEPDAARVWPLQRRHDDPLTHPGEVVQRGGQRIARLFL